MRKAPWKKLAILLLVVLNFGCDQISKGVVRKHVEPNDYIRVIGDQFILTNVENTGAMLGFGRQFSPLLKIALFQMLPILVLVVLLFRILRKNHLNTWSTLAFASVIGGGIGNLVDRIAYGSVTDFFQIKLGLFKTGIFKTVNMCRRVCCAEPREV